jgi:hypothetical protein
LSPTTAATEAPQAPILLTFSVVGKINFSGLNAVLFPDQ